MQIEILNNEIKNWIGLFRNWPQYAFNLLVQYAGYNESMTIKHYSDCSVLFMNGLVITINPFSDVKAIEDIFEELDEEVEIIDELGVWKC